MLVVVVRAVGEIILDQFASTQASVVRKVMVSVDFPRCPISRLEY